MCHLSIISSLEIKHAYILFAFKDNENTARTTEFGNTVNSSNVGDYSITREGGTIKLDLLTFKISNLFLDKSTTQWAFEF